jgi:16S rRNA processing protein RimM
MMETGANDVLVVAASEESIDDQERLIPFVMDEVVKQVDMKQRRLTVAWDKEY